MKYWFRRLTVWWLTIFVCVAVIACNSNLSQFGDAQSNNNQTGDNSSLSCRVIQHAGGETELCGQPQKVVALSPPLLDILLSLGVQPAGYAEVDVLNRKVFDDPSQQIPFLGDRVTTQPVNLGSRDSPSLETLLTLNPDLILGEKFSVEANYDQFSAIAPTAYFETIGEEGWKPVLQAIAAGLNRQDQAQQVLDAHDRHIEATRQKIAPLVAGQTIIVLGWQPIANQSFILERGFVTNLLEDLGFQVIVAGPDETTLSMESVAGLDVDHILIMPTGDNTIERAKQQWETHPILRSIPAVQSGNLYFMDYQLARIRGPIAAEIFIREFTSLLTRNQT